MNNRIYRCQRSSIHRALHDTEHPYHIQSDKLYKYLNGKELLIMCLILSNKGDADNPTPEDWVVVKKEIQERSGIPRSTFNKPWNELKHKGYIVNAGTQGSAKWIIYEDPDESKPTEAIFNPHNEAIFNPLTNINKTTIDNKDYSKEFNELKELYPTVGNKPDGTTYKLQGKLLDSKEAYNKYLNSGQMTHNEIMIALKVELNEKPMTGKTDFQPGLLKWINEKMFEVYKGRTVKEYEPLYGQRLE